MKHLGDITKIDGAVVEPVEVVIGGSPCQDLSVAGKREGLSGERSGLFMEQIRIIKEMRRKDIESGAVNPRPRYMVWENVPGAFSSNKGEDFRIVLEETARVCDPTAVIPRPEGGRWTYSGAILGDGWSIAWRVHDAQFWGVPQRRRRIALVADFGGYTAPEILFERNGLSRNTPPSSTPWKDFAAAIAERFGGTDHPKRTIDGPGPSRSTYCIQGNCIDRADTAGCNGKGWTEGVSYTLNTVDRPAVYSAGFNGWKSASGSIQYQEECAPTIEANMPPNVAHGFPLGFRPENVKTYKKKATTLCNGTRAGFCNGVITLDRAAFNQGINARYDMEISENGINSTLTARGPSAVCMATQQGGAEIRTDDKAPTLTAAAGMSGNNQPVYANAEHTVRRLTPLECERLQGYPDGWTDIGTFIDSRGKEKQASDSTRYKALGNSIALPSWAWMLERLSGYCEGHTMASLFDGIGGFPLIWETINGKGSCLWASEIEEFPIAVTKYHFGG